MYQSFYFEKIHILKIKFCGVWAHQIQTPKTLSFWGFLTLDIFKI